MDDIENADFALSFLVGVKYAVSSNSTLGIGFQGFAAAQNNGDRGFSLMDVQNEKFGFAVPIMFQAGF